MYLLDKLKPFEQNDYFSLKEQNGLGWNLAYVRKRPACWGIKLRTSRLEAKRSSPLAHQSPLILTPWQTDLCARQLYRTEWETVCLSGMTDNCTVRLVASISSFDSFCDQYYWSVYNCQSNQFSLIIVFIIGQLEP